MSGETKDKSRAQGAIYGSGTKMPLMKSSGQRSSVLGIMTAPGDWVGNEAKRMPN